MNNPRSAAACAAAAAILVASGAAASADGRLAPIAGDAAVSSHAPFEMGQCDACHATASRDTPGPLVKPGNALCFECHDEFRRAVKGHPRSAPAACVGCHSPHNARKAKLLL